MFQTGASRAQIGNRCAEGSAEGNGEEMGRGEGAEHRENQEDANSKMTQGRKKKEGTRIGRERETRRRGN